MAHDHGDEYQVRIIHEDGTEDLSGWMSGKEQVAQRWLRPAFHQAKFAGFAHATLSVPTA